MALVSGNVPGTLLAQGNALGWCLVGASAAGALSQAGSSSTTDLARRAGGTCSRTPSSSARLRDTVDLASVHDELAGAVQQALEPTHVSVWISLLQKAALDYALSTLPVYLSTGIPERERF
jgi:hypothetical protein